MKSWLRAVLAAPTYRFLQGGMLVVLVIAFATSFESGRAGARLLGFPVEAVDGTGHDFTAALPLVCDVVAGLATFVHGRVRTDPAMRALAARFVLVPMLLSWGANAIDHVHRAPAGVDWHPLGRASWIVAVIIGAGICPVAVAALLHFAAKFVEFEQREAEQAAQAAAREAEAEARRQQQRQQRSKPRPAVSPPVVPVGVPDEVAERRKRERERKADWRARKAAGGG